MIISDWEGPWVIADHAFEVTKRGVPNGEKLFSVLSEYDDYLAYVRKKPNYEPGDTLALIAPFLIAYNLDSNFLIQVAKDNANFIKGALEAIKILEKSGCAIKIISTSYCQYVHYTTASARIPRRNVKCTVFKIDKYIKTVSDKDKSFARQKVKKIISYPKLGISATVKEEELSDTAKRAIQELNEFFWEELTQMTFKEVLGNVKPLGGYRKYQAVMDFLNEENEELWNSVVIGDSITDWVMLKKTKEAGGLAVSFNGNEYAIRNSNLAVISDTCLIVPLIVDLFRKKGLSGVRELTENWSYQRVKNAADAGWIDWSLLEALTTYYGKSLQNDFPSALWITEENLEEIIIKSMEMRKRVRGVTVGSLG
ncbi:MAG: hypothetical protein QME50_06555 [Candidatus Bathyarchaeota archaeon]|nr:hypothetical protein [Candidatus Bathyarchaeota archaeon]MDI6798978.1 hypothetical protein [Candidatus Aenigmarchaeota archaeon]